MASQKTLLIHIGPPKTGTTSLQNWLQQYQNDDYYYLGVKQPRFTKNNIGIKLFMEYVRGNIEITSFLSKLDQLTDSRTIIVSEEMLIHGEEWKRNLRAIAKLKAYFDIYVSYCYRDTKKVIPSNYAECHSNLPEDLKCSYSKFIHSARIDAYRLNIIQKTLEDLGLYYHFFDFRKLVKLELNLNKIFNTNFDLPLYNQNIKLPNVNRTSKKESFYRAKVKTKRQMRLEAKIRRTSLKYLGRDLSPYFYRTYKLDINPNSALDKLAHENQIFWKNYTNE